MIWPFPGELACRAGRGFWFLRCMSVGFMILGMGNRIDYALPGPLTDLASVSPPVLERIFGAPADICWPVHALVIQPHDAKALGCPTAGSQRTRSALLLP